MSRSDLRVEICSPKIVILDDTVTDIMEYEHFHQAAWMFRRLRHLLIQYLQGIYLYIFCLCIWFHKRDLLVLYGIRFPPKVLQSRIKMTSMKTKFKNTSKNILHHI